MTGYQPQVGDRARATIEGRVARVSSGPAGQFAIEIHVGGGRIWVFPEDDGVTIEKLQDPEPKWVCGDVVRTKRTGHTAIRTRDGKWACTCPSGVDGGTTESQVYVSANWADGNLEILYKADAAPLPREAAYDGDYLS